MQTKSAKAIKKLLLGLAAVLAAAQILLSVFYVLFDKAGIILFIITNAVLTAGYIMLLILRRKLCKEINKLNNNETTDEYRKFELEYYELAKQHRQEIAAMRHEIANQLQVATSLLRSQAIEDKKKGAALLIDISQLNSLADINYCNNTIINTILTVKAKLAKAFDIRVRFDVAADDGISISKLDLCSIFGNLLDNAIEAAKRTDKKILELSAVERAGFFIIKIRNSKSNEIKTVDGEFATSKPDKESHGNGIKMLKRIAGKYDGKISFEYDDTVFTVMMTLTV